MDPKMIDRLYEAALEWERILLWAVDHRQELSSAYESYVYNMAVVLPDADLTPGFKEYTYRAFLAAAYHCLGRAYHSP